VRDVIGSQQPAAVGARLERARSAAVASVARAARAVEVATTATSTVRRQRAWREVDRIERAERVPRCDRGVVDSDDMAERFLRSWCDLMGATCAGFALVRAGEHEGSLASSGPAFEPIDTLQFELGEGPAIDAATTRRPVVVVDLAREVARWPAFAPAALARGVHACLAFPIISRQGTIVVIGYGDHALVRDDPSAFDRIRLLTHADAILARLLRRHEPDALASALVRSRRPVHQASGAIAIQLDVRVTDALQCLRARAWADDRAIADLAGDVVDGTSRLDA